MCDLCRLISGLVVNLFRSRAALEAEVLVLKQQIIVLRRGKPNPMPFLAVDRFVLGWVCHLFPKARDALAIVRPDTVVRWHRAGFRLFWRWHRQVYGAQEGAAVAGLEDVLAQLCVLRRWICS
jgi:hypothetical protein